MRASRWAVEIFGRDSERHRQLITWNQTVCDAAVTPHKWDHTLSFMGSSSFIFCQIIWRVAYAHMLASGGQCQYTSGTRFQRKRMPRYMKAVVYSFVNEEGRAEIATSTFHFKDKRNLHRQYLSHKDFVGCFR